MVVLMTACLGIGGYAYTQHQENVKLLLDIASYKTAAEANLKAKEDAEESCSVTVDSIRAHYEAQKALDGLQEAITGELSKLPTLTIKDKTNEAPKASQAVSYSDGDRLSPDLMRLLDQAYCYGDKDSCAQTSE